MAQSATQTSIQTKAQTRGIHALKVGALSPRMILLFILALIAFVASAVLIVWTRDQVVRYGYKINNANVELSGLKLENRKLIKHRYQYINPDSLLQASKRLGLQKPVNEQILVIYEKQLEPKD